MQRIRDGFKIMLLCALSLAVLLHSANPAQGSDPYRTTPTTNKGKKWRIGYYEGGPYINYPANLNAIAQGLADLAWMENTDTGDISASSDAKAVWMALGRTKSDYLQFVQDAFYSADWDELRRAGIRADLLRRLQAKELDFMIAMGTWAGQDLSNFLHSVPTMVVSSSDPVKAGISKGIALSGFDHVHARCDPNRYIRQIRLFHDIIGFKRLGIVYENTVAGRSYAALSDIQKAAAQSGFQIVACEAPWSGVSRQVSTQELIDCHKSLAPKIDALFLTVHYGVDTYRMRDILAPLIENKIPTWSQRGPQEVRNGVLLSISRGEFRSIGIYHAGIMAKIFNGAHPGALNQLFEDPKRIAINLTTAEAIGFKMPRGLLKVADEIYK